MSRPWLLTFALIAFAAPALAESGPVQLFKLVGPRDDVTIGMTSAELDQMGAGSAVERIARKLVADGQLTAWRYAVGRAPDGTTRFATTGRIAFLRNDTMRIEPYAASLPVAPPPSE